MYLPEVLTAASGLLRKYRPLIVKMQLSSSHLQFKSTEDSFAMWFIRTLNDIVRVDRIEETW